MAREVAPRSLKDRLVTVAKILWLVAIGTFAVWYFASNWEDVEAYASRVGLPQLLLSLTALIIGRVLLAEISRSSVVLFGGSISLLESFSINAVSQMGKYIPGSVWHLVGRVALYRGRGLTTRQGSYVLVVENVALLLSGLCVGFLPALEAGVRLIAGTRDLAPWVAAVVGFVGVGIWGVAVAWVPKLTSRRFAPITGLPRGRMFLLCLAFWTAFGLAFWLLLPADLLALSLLPAAMGTFALGWVAGNLAPFAPAGIGVREAVIVALMSPHVGVGVAVGAAAASRLVWTVGEVGVAPIASYPLARSESVPERQD